MPSPVADSVPLARPPLAAAPEEALPRRRRARSRSRRNLVVGLAFLAPNALGFLAFTAIPLVVSLAMAFTNWDLKLHNRYRDAERLAAGIPTEPVRFVGLANFQQLFASPDFGRYLGNTLFLMIVLPFAIAASLGAALLLSKNLRGRSTRGWLALVGGAVLVGAALTLVAAGAPGAGMTVVLCGLGAMILVAGTAGGMTVYRTLFYLPNFTASIATFLLWKKLYNPINGPITNALAPPLDALGAAVNGTPPALWHAGAWLIVAIMLLTLWATMRRLRALWADGDVGWAAALASAALLIVPSALAWRWFDPHAARIAIVTGAAAAVAWTVIRTARAERTFTANATQGAGGALMLAAAAMTVQFILIGLALISWRLPAWAAQGDGLHPPAWLTDPHWAKPSIMIMAFWSAVGSNTMLLYLAALSAVPRELYEAADLDGAGRFARFWNVTWPQLAPTTFFVVVMGVIGGLQGGFEMARVMTLGGPAGQTTTLSYYIYTQGFESGRLGFSSAVAWTLFLMVLIVTLVNWKVGSRYVND
jgi:multiple sugar transport system permease protein